MNNGIWGDKAKMNELTFMEKDLLELKEKIQDFISFLFEFLIKWHYNMFQRLKSNIERLVEDKMNYLDISVWRDIDDLELEMKRKIECEIMGLANDLNERLEILEEKLDDLTSKVDTIIDLLQDIRVESEVKEIDEEKFVEEDVKLIVFKEIYINNRSINELARKLGIKTSEIREIYENLRNVKESFIKYVAFYRPTKNEVFQHISDLPRWMYDLLLKIGEIIEVNDNGEVRVHYAYA